jgi:hypothetical protein
LKRIQSRVVALDLVEVLHAGSVVPQYPQSIGQLIVVGRHAAGIPERTEVLSGIETPPRSMAECAGASAAAAGAVCLGGILDNSQPMPLRDLH